MLDKKNSFSKWLIETGTSTASVAMFKQPIGTGEVVRRNKKELKSWEDFVDLKEKDKDA